MSAQPEGDLRKAGPDAAFAKSAPRTLTSAELLRGAHEIVILHAGEAYRLRLTRNDRLILTK